MNERRIQRLQELIKHRVAQVIDHELADPRRGLVTITKVKLDREMMSCDVFWSILGDEKARRLNAKMLEDARAFVQREVAGVLSTRTVPHLRFRFDESIEGALRIESLLADIRKDREAGGPEQAGSETGSGPMDDDDAPDADSDSDPCPPSTS